MKKSGCFSECQSLQGWVPGSASIPAKTKKNEAEVL
jgi:hypothetical protein